MTHHPAPLPAPLPARGVPRPPAAMFGVPIADVTMDETVALIGELVLEGRTFGRTHQVSTVNVDFLVNALEHDDVARILQHAEVCLPDGMPVVWASKLLGMPVRERVAGADLVPRLIEASGTSGWHVHLFGSTPEVADEARSILRERYPDARFTIDPGPMMPDVERIDESVLRSIIDVDADILCVALGNPKQERFIAAHRDRLNVPVMIGVGGSLDMIVGKQRRAPSWMRRYGLEWVWRACFEPRRLGARYLRDARVFSPAIIREWQANRTRAAGHGLRIELGSQLVVSIGGERHLDTHDWGRAVEALFGGYALEIDGTSGAMPHDRALSQLVGLVAAARRGGAPVTWSPGSSRRPDWIDEYRIAPSVLGMPE